MHRNLIRKLQLTLIETDSDVELCLSHGVDFFAKKSARCNRVLVLTELIIKGPQCKETLVLLLQVSERRGGSRAGGINEPQIHSQ